VFGYSKYFYQNLYGFNQLTTISFPAFSGLFAILMAAAAAAPDDIPT
jgi:hypothetical protein